MKMPGFTAEGSLGRPAMTYTMGTTDISAIGDNILPQLRWQWPEGSCIPGCICVSPIDCPCCVSFPFPKRRGFDMVID